MANCADTVDLIRADAGKRLADGLRAAPQYGLLRLEIHPSLSQRACWFCGCVRQPADLAASDRPQYVEALRREIAAAARLLDGRGQTASVGFGAGGPFCLSPEQIASLLDVIECELGLTNRVRIAVELQPFEVRQSGISALRDQGLGAVTVFCTEGGHGRGDRDGWFEQIESAVGVLRAAEIVDLGIAVFADLPGREAAEVEDFLFRVLSLGPDRVHACAMGDRVRRDPAFRNIPTPPNLTNRFVSSVRAAGYLEVAPGVLVRPERRLEGAAAAESRLAASTLGFGAGALSQLAGVNYRNPRGAAAYISAVAAEGLAAEIAASAPQYLPLR